MNIFISLLIVVSNFETPFMNDYNIENSIENIHSEKTKEYFKEVSSSYLNGNYRASIVTLYSVVISDILFKLEFLNEIYQDKVAFEILEQTKQYQVCNPTSSDWENDIVDKIKTRTSIIDNVDYTHIQSLRSLRHLCAHPVIDKEDKLYTPNKETVASNIRNMMDALFLKPPILSKKILSNLLEDISKKKDLFIEKSSLRKYLTSKYLNNLNPNIEVAIFRDLWKFVFRLTEKKAEDNRYINYSVLNIIYERNIKLCIDKIKSEKDYFSNIKNESRILNFLIKFISTSEFIISEFREDVQLYISKQVENNDNAKVVAWFLSENYTSHLDYIKDSIKNNGIGFIHYANGSACKWLLEIGISKGFQKEVLKFIIWRVKYIRDFNDGDGVFAYVIKPFIDKFSENQIIKLCLEIDKNSQAHSRKKAEEDHKQLKSHILKLNGEFDFKKFENTFA